MHTGVVLVIEGNHALVLAHCCNALGNMSKFCQIKKSAKKIIPSPDLNSQPLLCVNNFDEPHF